MIVRCTPFRAAGLKIAGAHARNPQQQLRGVRHTEQALEDRLEIGFLNTPEVEIHVVSQPAVTVAQTLAQEGDEVLSTVIRDRSFSVKTADLPWPTSTPFAWGGGRHRATSSILLTRLRLHNGYPESGPDPLSKKGLGRACGPARPG